MVINCKNYLYLLILIVLGFGVFGQLSKCHMESFEEIYDKRKSTSCTETKM